MEKYHPRLAEICHDFFNSHEEQKRQEAAQILHSFMVQPKAKISCKFSQIIILMLFYK